MPTTCGNRRGRSLGGKPTSVRADQTGGDKQPFQIRAQVLRDWEACVPAQAFSALMPLTPEEPVTSANSPAEPPAAGKWRQADVRHAIAAAQQAGLTHYRVEISSDGNITLLVGEATPPDQSGRGLRD